MRPIWFVDVLLLAGTVLAQLEDIGPPPGKLIDIGGRKLHIHCTGAGSPAVIFEAGASSFAIDFSLVQPAIAKTNRVCSYDRLGHGWSDPRGTGDGGTIANLHALLQKAGEKPPYLLVGASRGGLYVRLYQAQYPEEIIGLVLLDPAYEERLFTMFEGKAVTIASLTAEQFKTTMTPGPPIKIPKRSPQTGDPFDRLPADLYKTRIALDQRLIASMPDELSREVIAKGQEAERAELAKLRNLSLEQTHPLGDLPLVILTRSHDTNAERNAVFSLLAKISSNSRHTVVRDAGHEIHLFQPAAVVEGIHDVLAAARTKSRLPAR